MLFWIVLFIAIGLWLVRRDMNRNAAALLQAVKDCTYQIENLSQADCYTFANQKARLLAFQQKMDAEKKAGKYK